MKRCGVSDAVRRAARSRLVVASLTMIRTVPDRPGRRPGAARPTPSPSRPCPADGNRGRGFR